MNEKATELRESEEMTNSIAEKGDVGGERDRLDVRRNAFKLPY